MVWKKNPVSLDSYSNANANMYFSAWTNVFQRHEWDINEVKVNLNHSMPWFLFALSVLGFIVYHFFPCVSSFLCIFPKLRYLVWPPSPFMNIYISLNEPLFPACLLSCYAWVHHPSCQCNSNWWCKQYKVWSNHDKQSCNHYNIFISTMHISTKYWYARGALS